MKKVLRVLVIFVLLPALLYAQGLPIKSGADSNLATVDANKNVRVSTGASTRVTYIVSASGLTAATAHTLSIEAPTSPGFKLVQWCVGLSTATAASSITITVQRRTSASSGGTALSNEGTGTTVISKMDPGAASFGGIGRLDGTLGTAAAVLDQYNYEVGVITSAGSTQWVCQRYDYEGAQLPIVSGGTSNGLSINVPSLGAGSLATSISATIIAE